MRGADGRRLPDAQMENGAHQAAGRTGEQGDEQPFEEGEDGLRNFFGFFLYKTQGRASKTGSFSGCRPALCGGVEAAERLLHPTFKPRHYRPAVRKMQARNQGKSDFFAP